MRSQAMLLSGSNLPARRKMPQEWTPHLWPRHLMTTGAAARAPADALPPPLLAQGRRPRPATRQRPIGRWRGQRLPPLLTWLRRPPHAKQAPQRRLRRPPRRRWRRPRSRGQARGPRSRGAPRALLHRRRPRRRHRTTPRCRHHRGRHRLRRPRRCRGPRAAGARSGATAQLHPPPLPRPQHRPNVTALRSVAAQGHVGK